MEKEACQSGYNAAADDDNDDDDGYDVSVVDGDGDGDGADYAFGGRSEWWKKGGVTEVATWNDNGSSYTNRCDKGIMIVVVMIMMIYEVMI